MVTGFLTNSLQICLSLTTACPTVIRFHVSPYGDNLHQEIQNQQGWGELFSSVVFVQRMKHTSDTSVPSVYVMSVLKSRK